MEEAKLAVGQFEKLLQLIDRLEPTVLTVNHPFRVHDKGDWKEMANQSQSFTGDMWFHVPLLRIPERGRGSMEDCIGLTALFADLDAEEGKLRDLETCWSVVHAVSGLLGAGPAAVVMSGHGLQPYWKLSGPGTRWEYGDTESRDYAQLMLRGFGALVQFAAKTVTLGMGRVDSGVYELARVLRVPGTVNLKREPMNVQLCFEDPEAASVSFQSLLDLLLTLPLDQWDSPERPGDRGGFSQPRLVFDGREDLERFHLLVRQKLAELGFPMPEWNESERAWRCACPNHAGDGQPHSLTSLKYEVSSKGKFVWHCFSGCAQMDVASAVGFEMGKRVESDTDFFEATPVLRYAHDIARAKVVSPHALLAVLMARAVAMTPHNVRIPSIIGSRASLNFFVGLVGGSGTGKTAVVHVASEVLPLPLVPFTPASGEGILEKIKAKEPPEAYPRAFVVIDEIMTLMSVQDRRGSTVAPLLRTLWSGADASTAAASSERTREVRAHSYRVVLITGIQPDKARVLLDDHGAGTPQRFLFVSLADPGAEEGISDPGYGEGANPLHGWRLPAPAALGRWESVDIAFEQHVHDIVRAERLEAVRTGGSTGHSMLLRLKTAAALALLHGTTSVDDFFWDLAGWLVKRSDEQLQMLFEHERKAKRNRAKEMGKLDVVKQEAAQEDQLEKTMQIIQRRASQSGTKRSEFRRMLGVSRRPFMDEALDRLVEAERLQYDPTMSRYYPL